VLPQGNSRENLSVKRDATAVTFALVFPTILAWFYFLTLATSGDAMSRAQQLTYTLGKLVQFAFPLLFLWWRDRTLPRPARPGLRGLEWGLAFGVIVCGILFVLYYGGLRDSTLLAQTPERIREKLQQFGITTFGRYVALGLFLSGLHSLLEEYYWRWFVFGQLRRLLPRWPAIVLSSLGFMAHHVIVLYVYLPGRFWDGVVPLSLCVALGGAVWAWLYERTGSLYAPWVSHLLVDAAIFVVGYDLVWR
jgi:membrane protease YdiL (CAAX protease family)